ncbi:putative glycoside hydrolase [Amycolatopsis arida]|uniref:putative glycoside hydrolase n=1 Tax=Amycolatopsis arida TaxID=587909 RepID=UPI001FBB60FA|nr:putative glycoside hydrolase [Amycolatopsis arida]
MNFEDRDEPGGADHPDAEPSRRRPLATRLLLGGVIALVGVVAALVVGMVVPGPTVAVAGSPGDVLAGGTLRVTGVVSDAQVLMDGRPVAAQRDGDRLVVDVSRLEDGEHALVVRVPRALPLLPAREVTHRFRVDTTPPELEVADPVQAESLRGPVVIRGRARQASAVTVDDVPARLVGDEFTVELPRPPAVAHVVARDEAGNVAERDVTVQVRHPGMRAVHMSALAWSSPSLREPVLQMIREGRIDTVQLDIKDESGEVGYDSQVPLAREVGAVKGYYDAEETLSQLHAMGVRVVARLVAFRDPLLGAASWRGGQTDRVVQTTDGRPWSAHYGQYAFTNFAHPEVRQYNIDLATEAAELGFDDILYDYVRRPDGPIAQMVFPGLEDTPEHSIAEFLRQTRHPVRAQGAFLGASVFGIAATRPTQIGQDISAMAHHVDYIAPMVYPSHWGAGEYGVANPPAQPYDIVHRSLADFGHLVEGTAVTIIPWLQAFSLGHHYGPAEIQAQITAAGDNGMSSFLLWNAACRYDSSALQPAG